MQKVKTFFWYCSGANSKLLKKSPTDSSKYVGIGATIFFTGLFAALAGGYGFYTVFDSYWIAGILGLVWGLMIFNLDRFIVSGMRKENGRWYEVLMATPRIILAIFISLVIAKPLELKIFEKEINAELATMEQEIYTAQENNIKNKYLSEKAALLDQIATLKKEVVDKTSQRDELNRIAQQEADGTGGTGKRNAGPIYRIKKADADKVNEELKELTTTNNIQIEKNYNRIAAVDDMALIEVTALAKEDIGGPAARLEALSRLSSKSEAIWWANFFIVLLFIVVETAPIFVKLISKKGPYDYLLQEVEYGYEAGFFKNKAFIHAEIKKEAAQLENKEKQFVSEKLDINLDSA